MEWDVKSDYIACFSRKKLNFVKISAEENEDPICHEMELNPQFFTDILDIQVDSRYGGIEGNLKCEIAVKAVERNTIIFMDFKADQSEAIQLPKRLSYYSEETKNVIVKISEDFKSAMLCFGTQKYILKQSKNSDLWHQLSLAHIGRRKVISIASFEDRFLFAAVKAFDKNLMIMSSFDHSYKLRITRRLERANYKVFDMHIDQSEFDSAGFPKNLQIMSIRDDQFFVDQVRPRLGLDICEDAGETISFMFTKYEGFSAQWPFISF